ncbi:hypothetical protein Hdeb2414_s0001g00008591 [Helianthus debilis subsp. tardiflorus]
MILVELWLNFNVLFQLLFYESVNIPQRTLEHGCYEKKICMDARTLDLYV